jgi:hypothetical protein
MRGLDLRIHPFSPKGIDCRVKPGNDPGAISAANRDVDWFDSSDPRNEYSRSEL